MLSIDKYRDVYSDIVSTRKVDAHAISTLHQVPFQVVTSIISFHTIFDFNTVRIFNGICNKHKKYVYDEYLAGKSLRDMSTKLGVPMSLLGKSQWSKVDSSKNTSQYASYLLQRYMGDTALRRMCFDMYFAGDMYGMSSNRIRNTVGKVYEQFTALQLNILGISFLDDQELRRSRQVKTPDFRLQQGQTMFGRQIHWVEVKAGFGSPHAHKHYLPQFRGYVARYGPGLVVYYGGCVREINYNYEDIQQRIQYEEEIQNQVAHKTKPFQSVELNLTESTSENNSEQTVVYEHQQEMSRQSMFPEYCVTDIIQPSTPKETSMSALPDPLHMQQPQQTVWKAQKRVLVPTPVKTTKNPTTKPQQSVWGSNSSKRDFPNDLTNPTVHTSNNMNTATLEDSNIPLQNASTKSTTEDLLHGLVHPDILVLPYFPAFNIYSSWRK